MAGFAFSTGRRTGAKRDMLATMRLDDDTAEIVGAAREAVSFADLAPSLRTMERLLGASGALLFGYGESPEPLLLGGSLLSAMAGYDPQHYATDPLHPCMRRLSPRFFVRLSDDWIERDTWIRSHAYRDFYRRIGAHDLIGLWLTDGRYADPGMVGVLLVGTEPLRPDAERLLRTAREPLRQAARRVKRFEALREEHEAVVSLLERGISAVDVVWDGSGRRMWMSSHARALLEDRPLPRALVDAVDAHRRPHRRCPPSGVRLGGGVHASFFTLRDVPSREPWICATLEPDTADRPIIEPLTQAETRVLELLSDGLSNANIARRLDVSIETVRTHVKSILRKLSCDNRSQACLRARDLGLARRVGR